MKGIMVDAGATSHIVNDIGKFEIFVDSFQSETNSVELADGTKCNGIAQRRGTAMVCLLDNTGRQHRAQLRDALYMPSYPHDIFSVTERIQPGKVTETGTRKNPPRTKRRPTYLQEFETEDTEDRLQTCVDSCYRAVCDIPRTYQDAIASTKSRQWENAMNKEMRSLEENETFKLTQLPPGKRAVGGRWVYALKSDIDGSERYKARFVAKGYSQKPGTDYGETFSPTVDMTSIRVVMQKAAQENLVLHQMDVKTAYLHAPIDCEIYMEQPEGFEKGQKRVKS
ncbi:hypothetical protein AAFF_G00115920 [Aldrovandia affinis]|uniref:Reverse transcriptase Ty1/copia-type domain-containing protein n=1 Tax=Aldrovandia affinis TaxID=143900 RepID=A0AAD7T3A3_9TELE|nr:hypothetical protein AAFF_G00115920 [Aldrovandia affinis]